MEAMNILLVPGAAFLFAPPKAPVEIVAMVLASLATATFLLVGALYWRGLDRRLRAGDRAGLEQALSIGDRLEKPGLALIFFAGAGSALAVAFQGWTWPCVAACLLTLLAALEYVNYYKRQLQHFDNWTDFKRLITGRGFKPAHMARELAAFRKVSLRKDP
jgi:hypothetical protein